MNETFQRAVSAVAESNLLVVATGAGMSKESGIPTFRDSLDGLWARYDPQELATREGFRHDPPRVWGWYNYRRKLISELEPHGGHRAIARLEALLPQVVVVTQNIDGFHRLAGSTGVLELHGNINRFKCYDRDHPVEEEVPLACQDGPVEPPRCGRCGSPLRPDVVWFGEMLPPGVFEQAETLARSCDAMLVVGTSGIVYPAAALPMSARSGGATVIEVNVEPSEVTPTVDVFLQGAAGEVLPALVAAVEEERSRAN
ncbi:MAG: NAD-dependent deacylase [Gemmatimonadetes bacterium]|uniref:NAD-dependent protein deacylase n=1 Tax=Candidatus Kutchimonas denitrificans TaxID=3056748 RepID=A0AAE4ZA53_9BACT|nr:NAD-dependent deacylase [Gemmatimonadota bacterium]NIR75367.1 NAD-dependent deacylase [Candidatus Kutchimonas denitrificans]NIS01009.1 NAD-dependent deacylase [Gemmatimonadota bacterium]NIT66633.1 NAD-dependent deacylase [Gemmatimonadota bacterium]NIU53213.1 NAD-dependent protein deacylase [Gemmatimonadota bacterium]